MTSPPTPHYPALHSRRASAGSSASHPTPTSPRTRLAHAATLLHTTDATLTEIATRTGYGTEFSFSKAFKRAFAIAPGAYRGQPGHVPRLDRGRGAATIAK